MIKIGKVSAINDDKVSVFFSAFDDATAVELPVMRQYADIDYSKIHVDDVVVVGYTPDGTGIVLGHL